MQLLFLYGLPASGKLTIGAEVARRSGLALFHHHLVVDALLEVFAYGSREFVALRDKFWFDTIAAAAHSGRSLVFTFCPEPSVAPDFPARVAQAVAAADGTICFVRLDVAPEEQERRLVLPSRGGRKLRRVAVMRSVRAEFEAAIRAMPAPALAIDTTATPVAEAAGRIMQLLR